MYKSMAATIFRTLAKNEMALLVLSMLFEIPKTSYKMVHVKFTIHQS